MEGRELKEGKDRVQTYLLDHLELIGMKRVKGQTLEKQAAMFERLRCLLAYMPKEMLLALSDMVHRHAGGILRNQWPEEATLLNWARDLMKPPASESHLVRSFVESVGERALVQGHLTEVFLYLKTYGKPPTEGGWRMIRERAAENKRRAALAEERGDPRELAWLDGHNQSAARALKILDDKKAKAAAE